MPFEFSWSSVGEGTKRETKSKVDLEGSTVQTSGGLGLEPNMDIPDGFEVFRGDFRPESSD